MANQTLVDILRDIVGSTGDITTASDGVYYDLIKRPDVKIGDILNNGVIVDGGLLKAIDNARLTISSIKDTVYGDDPITGSTGSVLNSINQAKTDVNAKSENVDIKYADFDTKYTDFTSGDIDKPAKYETFEQHYSIAEPEFDKIQVIGNDLLFKNQDGSDRVGNEFGKSLIKEVTDNLLKGNSSEVVKVGTDLMQSDASKVINVGDALQTGNAIDVVYKDMTDTQYSNILNAKTNAESALLSKNDANISKERANEWAEKDVGVEISGTTGQYSAKSYANDSKASATESETSRQASEAAMIASEAVKNQITSLTTSTLTLIPGSDATSNYNSSNGILTIGVPIGSKGDKGDPFSINAIGEFSIKVNSNNQQKGFTFLSTNGYGPQPEEVTSTNFDGDISLAASSTITWNGSTTIGYNYEYVISVKNGTAGSVELFEDTTSLGTITGNNTIRISHVTEKNDLHFTSDANFNGTIDISIKRIRSQDASVFFKTSSDDGDYWSEGTSFGKGDKGDAGIGISNVSFLSTTSTDGTPGKVDGVDTYRITYTDGTIYDFSVANGTNQDLSGLALKEQTDSTDTKYTDKADTTKKYKMYIDGGDITLEEL